MANSSKAARCCSMEKKRLIKELQKCDLCSDNYEEFHNCYRAAAKESGKRSRVCIIN